MKRFLIYICILNKPIKSVDNSILISHYFNSDGTIKTNDLINLKYFFLIPIIIYFILSTIFSIIYYVYTGKVKFVLFWVQTLFNYKINKNNQKYEF